MTSTRGTDPVPRSRVRTPSAELETLLIDAAETVLQRDGAAAVTVRAVATEANVAPMGIYNRLGGKDGLVDALLIRGFDGLRAAVQGRDEGDALENLRASGVRYRRFALENPQYYGVMFGGTIPRASSSDAVHEHAAAAFEALVANVAAAIAAAKPLDTDPLEMAQQIWSSVHGAVSLELAGLVLTADPATTYSALLDVLMRGLRPGVG